MTKNSDGIFKDWGERLDYSAVKGRKGKNIRSGKSADSKPQKPSGPATREKLAMTTKRVPEVMVKITGGGKNMNHIEASIKYISRDGEVEIEDENGEIYLGLDGVKDVRDAWAKGRIGIPDESQKRKEAFNIFCLCLQAQTEMRLRIQPALLPLMNSKNSSIFLLHMKMKNIHMSI